MAIIDVIQKKLNVQPDGIPTVVRLSQNENGRELVFDVENCEIPAGSTVTISGTKPDGVVYSLVGSISDNTVTFNEDIQMTAVGGQWDAKVVIVNGGNTVATGRVRFIIDPDTVDPDAVPSDSQLEGLVAQAQEYAELAKGAAYGAPYVASTVAEMTDHDHVYVYTGSETGYTAGNWYYWNGSAWTSGGTYNSVAVATDKTLSVSDMAADAKVTGDKIAEVKSTLEYQEDNGFLRKNYFDVYGNINTKRDGTTETAVALVNIRNGTKLIVNASGARSYGVGQLISGVSGSVRFSFDVESLGNGSKIVSRIYDISNYGSPITTITADNIGTYSLDIVLDANTSYAFVWYVQNGTAPCGGVISNIEIYDPSVLSNVELLKTCKAPSLNDSMKTAIRTLINDYYDNRAMFSYYSTSTRNDYATADTCFGGSGRAVFNCSTFVQMILMGRSVSDFANKDTYSNIINKTFDNGFYFNFPMRVQAYQLAERENDEIIGYYGFRHKGGDTYEGSFSYNTHYSNGTTNLYKQVFNTFMYACDMANELYQLGCEINFSELEIGDLVFFYDIDSSDGSFADTAFRNIIHVAMVENIYVSDGNKVVYFAESTGTYGGYPQAIIKWSLFSPSEKDRAKASYYLAHIAMCARNPIAYNFSGHDVPEAITAI